MTISDIGSIGELVGAIATVATLIYIAIQIRENTSWTKRQALEKIIDRVINWGARFNENPDILKIYLEGLSDFDSFDDQKKHRYHFVLGEILVACEAVIEHGKSKTIKLEATEAIDKRILFELRGSGARSWWNQMGRERYSSDFSRHVDNLLEQSST